MKRRAFVAATLALVACGGDDGSGACEATLGLSGAECATVRAMRLPSALPPARGNLYGDHDDAATLGFKLFFRRNLGHGTSCANCHQPELTFTDRLSVSVGVGQGTRNAPTVFNAARLSVMFWDGKADSLWSQPLFAIESPVEMASSRVELLQTLAADTTLRPLYEAVFGALPDTASLPATGKPGDASWEALSVEQQTAVNRFAANVGKAFEAYQRKNTTGDASLDRYLDGDLTAIGDLAKQGLVTFVRAGCAKCHAGSSFTDEKFHDAGFGSVGDDAGRAGAIAVLESNPFTLAGPFSDEKFTVDTSDRTPGAFRTAPLRNVSKTSPYGHAGTHDTLGATLAFHAATLSDSERGALLAFLLELNGDYPMRPWSDWPQPQ